MDTLSSSAQNDNTPEKRCTGPCGRMLPATTEFFHRNGPNVLRPDCKECRGKKVKAYYERPEVHEQRLAYTKDYRSQPEIHEHIQEHKKAYYSQPEVQAHKREYTREYRTRPGVLERKYAWDKEYNSRPEVKERHRAYDRTFQHRRRVRVKTNGGNYTVQQVQELLKRQKYMCHYAACGHAKFEKKNGKYIFHVDHVVPLSRGGSNAIDNIVLACPSCNQHKQSRLPHEWPEGGRLL